MSDASTSNALHEAADKAGIDVVWHDVNGARQIVADDSLRAVLAALGDTTIPQRAPLLTADPGMTLHLPGQPGQWSLHCESGAVHGGNAEWAGDGMVHIHLPTEPGYHTLYFGDSETTIAIAPPRCWTVADALADRLNHKCWGLATQLYALRRAGDGGIGDFAALAILLKEAGALGAAAVAISPVHAQFSADPGRFSPYSPSSRTMLNVLHAVPATSFGQEQAVLERAALLDWPAAAAIRLQALHADFEAMSADSTQSAHFAEYRRDRGEALERHARFEALHAAQLARAQAWDWQNWPEEFRDPSSPGVARFAAENAQEVAYHAFLQQQAERGLSDAQADARAAGMAVGIIADIAVGTASSGSDAWCDGAQMLRGLSIGAPPDIWNAKGQDWGVTTYAPHGLIANGYGAFIRMLRASLRNAGGVRIDHVMGLARLWVVPHGAPAMHGAYLRYPVEDLLRLVRLESHRHKAVILGEDLGTLPHGFRDRLDAAGLAGLSVMLFEREGNWFRPPREWRPDNVAMTTTHDLPTVAGWWSGRDLEWRRQLNFDSPENCERLPYERDAERQGMWSAFQESGATQDAQPAPEQMAAATDAACAHLATAACSLSLLPIEDALALREQPNIPGTTDEHPNWRRRLPGDVNGLLHQPGVRGRLEALSRGRRS
jgi:4-alpha-glucanotransferase